MRADDFKVEETTDEVKADVEQPIEYVGEEKVAEPIVEQPKPESPKVEPTPEPEERPPLTIVSNEDAYIANRMKSQPQTLDEVLEVKEPVYAPGKHRLSLPDELLGYEDRFRFRWVNRKKRALDDAIDVKGWNFVNKALFPHLDKHLFTTGGAIERGDAVLMFMSQAKAKAINKMVHTKAKQQRDSNPMLNPPQEQEGQSGFYKPKDTSAEKDGVDCRTQQGFQEDRDF